MCSFCSLPPPRLKHAAPGCFLRVRRCLQRPVVLALGHRRREEPLVAAAWSVQRSGVLGQRGWCCGVGRKDAELRLLL